jgi:rubrerythrin
MSKLVELLEKQRDMELEHVERLKPSVDKAGHRLVSALLETILHDSRKHAALCQALLDLEAGAAPVTLDVDMGAAVGLHQDIRAHVQVEEKMIARLESIRDGVEEPRIREIVGHLLADERRHHNLLQRLSNIIDSDTAAYDEYLGLIQKYMVSPP